ncbi:hypothetical protein E6H34_02115 [Candidatus Bathyarchaeota archaeon]|nr:MAG: hypothetical protein E6H34_02115 [Candidatus Bathyarchaeota archaeon]
MPPLGFSIETWEGKQGIVFEKDLVREYLNGSSQSRIAERFHIEWSKLRQVLLSHRVPIRGKSQQMLMDLHGRFPKVRPGLSRSKLYIIFAMFGDGLRPTSQTKHGTHLIGIAAGKDRDFADNWISQFEQEYSVRPTLRTVGVNNIQASISSLDIWNDLHCYATFGTRSWGLRKESLRCLKSDKMSRLDVGHGLKGLFDADGSVKYEVKRSSRQVTVSSVNWEGLQQVSTLLDKIGVRHSVYEDCIAIFGRSNLLDYQRMIGFGIARKREALNNMISTYRVQ